MLQTLDLYGRRVIAWPLAMVGVVFSLLSEGLIRLAAWIVGIDPDAEDEWL